MYDAITVTEISLTDYRYWPILKQQCSILTQMSWKNQKLYKKSDKCDGQQQFKDIIDPAMVFTTEGFTEESPISPMT